MLKDKVEVVCYRLHGDGPVEFIKQLNEKIEQGYRFTVPKTRSEMPQLRHGYPKFTMNLPGTELVVEEAVSEVVPEDILFAWSSDKEVVQKFLEQVEELSIKTDLVDFNDKFLHFTVPEDKKVPTAIKAYLLSQLKSFL